MRERRIEERGEMKKLNCHIALAPIPWMRSRVSLVGLCDFGTQQWMTVPAPRSVVVDLRPAPEKDCL
jgi:hypothetical protein